MAYGDRRRERIHKRRNGSSVCESVPSVTSVRSAYDRPKSLPLDEPLGLPNELPVLPLLNELVLLPPA